jgi:chemotaxis protein methyltransferase CheR
MTQAEFAAIRDLIQARAGIYFADDAAARLEFRLRDRLAATGCTTYAEYYLSLQRGREGEREFQQVIELITTHETYFFRERNQLDAFSQEILPELHRRLADTRRLRVWSAGCATGEEAYTIAMLIHEHGGFRGWNVQILGTDISTQVIERARAAIYGENSFRETPPARQERYFERLEGRHRVSDEVRALADFAVGNLVDSGSTSLVAQVDVVFCRNVLIYFHHDAKRDLAELFFRKLRPGGYLLLGHAESLLNVSTKFEVVSLRHDLAYRRPEREWAKTLLPAK